MKVIPKAVAVVLALAAVVLAVVAVDTTRRAMAAVTTPVAPAAHMGVLAPPCEDTAADVLCSYYDEDDQGVQRYWLYPAPQSRPEYRVVVELCPTEDSDAVTCLRISHDGATFAYLPIAGL